ncbi:MAG: 2,3-bisphosphoglycerate-independent phosphoglycerate mutase [Flavobacteriales bacterium]
MKNNPTPQRCALLILDGWGIGQNDASNAIASAQTPFMDELLSTSPNATLRTDGEHVGLPEGQMGNSEVGHMNIGAGRIVYQDLLRINRAVITGELGHEKVLREALEIAKKPGKRLHFMGLVSQGGVHSQQAHLHELCRIAADAQVNDFVIHAFTDGRDTAPQTGRGYIADLEDVLAETGGRIASVHGRYFAMDRDQRWPRISQSFATLVRGEGIAYATADEGIAAQYKAGITDEFIPPFIVGKGTPIQPGDVVICFNFRTDRCREISSALTQKPYPEFDMAPIDVHYVTLTNYDDTFEGVHVIYDKPHLTQTLGEVLSATGKSQIRIAETEKYPHVTFFFNGGREVPFDGETRLMAHSPKVATYDLQPEMSAHDIVAAIVPELEAGRPDFVCLNFANPDMVGHTGVFDAIVQAVETTDTCLKAVVEAGRSQGYQMIIIADHGNADYARNPDGSPHTAHTTNPVPVIVLSDAVSAIHDGVLADIAPTVLKLMGVDQPVEMTGKSLY